MAEKVNTRVRWWICGEGHLFAYGDEQWHYEEHADQGTEEYPVPRHCPCDFSDDHPDEEMRGESCMESSYLWGGFKTREDAEQRRPDMRRRAEGIRQEVRLRAGSARAARRPPS